MQDVIAGIEQFVKTTWWQCNKTGHKIWTKETFMQEENSLSSPNYKASLHHLFPGLLKFWIFTFSPFCSMSTKSMEHAVSKTSPAYEEGRVTSSLIRTKLV